MYSVKRRQQSISLYDNLVSAIFKRSESALKELTAPQTQVDKYRVLLVDDEPDVLAIFKSFLLGDGYDVEAFSDSYRALQAFARLEPYRFDLIMIILDIRMPSMNGLQLYQRLKAIDPHIKVVFLTALDATDELVSVLDGITTNRCHEKADR